MAEVRIRPDAGDGASPAVAGLTVGDVLVVELAENATTGYQWTAESVPDELVELPAEGGPAELPAAAGAAVPRSLRFGAARPGAGELRLRHARSWEREPLQVLALPIEVAP